MQKNNSIRVLNLVIKQLNIPVTRQSISEELIKHPDFPSLLAISDVLNNWNILNASYTATFDELIDSDVPFPFISCTKKGEFLLINKLNEKEVIVSNEIWNNQRLSADDFKKDYLGTILAFQKDETSGEADYPSKRRKELIDSLRVPAIIFGLAIMLVAFLLTNPSFLAAFSWPVGFLILFKTIGLGASVMLLVQSIDSNNPLIQKFCGGDHNKNCNAILSSKAAKLSDELSWSEIGFFYFAGTWLALLFNPGHSSLIQMLALLNIVSLPYTFYSIYYQWRVAKQWCIFCTTVQALLWLEFFAFLPYLFNGLQNPNLKEWCTLLTCMLAPVLLWVFIKPYLLQLVQVQPLKQQLYKFKYDTDLFQSNLNKEVKYALLADDDSIVIGNPAAKNVITMVSNPFCRPCAKAHKVLDNLIISRDDVKLQFVFVPRIYSRARDNAVLAHFMSLKLGNDNFLIKRALNDWYKQENKSYESWRKYYPIGEAGADFTTLEKQRSWCRMTEIDGTPAIFINGRRLPQAYQTEDLKYIIK